MACKPILANRSRSEWRNDFSVRLVLHWGSFTVPLKGHCFEGVAVRPGKFQLFNFAVFHRIPALSFCSLAASRDFRAAVRVMAGQMPKANCFSLPVTLYFWNQRLDQAGLT